MYSDLKGKVAIVTGSASGIGKVIAETLVRECVITVVADIDVENGKRTVEELNRKGPSKKNIFIHTDVSERESVESMVDEVVKRFGRIDILVNNAGINIPRLLVDPKGKQEITDEIWERTVSINQKGTYLCSQAVVRHMIKKGNNGVIINVSSESALEGSHGQSVYAGTKAAIYSYTRSWAKELGRFNIRVVGVAPGILEPTSMRTYDYEKALAYTRGITVDELRSAYKNLSIPLRRVGRLEEVAEVICFLASEKASYITGTVINISGGKSRA